MRGAFRDHHALDLDATPPSKVARERKPFLTNDLLAAVRGRVSPELSQFYESAGVVAAGARPLEFRGELMGVIGMMSKRPFDPQAFELLGIFADQAAMAIKSAHVFTRARAVQGATRDRERVPQGRDPNGARFRGDRRSEHRAARGAAKSEAGRPGRHDGAAHGRDRDGKGAHRPRDSFAGPAEGSRDDQDELRRDPARRRRESSCSGMRRARSPARCSGGSAGSSWRTRARCSWTKSASCRSTRRPSCCACSRSRSSSGSAACAPIKVDVRLVAATNRDLEVEVAEGAIPAGPLLPAQRLPDSYSAAPRAAGRHSTTR